MNKTLFIIISIYFLIGCKQPAQNVQQVKKLVAVPSFSTDSAFNYIQSQVNFGARVPNSSPHKECAIYLSSTLKRMGAEVVEQRAELTAFDGTKLNSVNIIGTFNPASKKRILLCSHWDSRPWADNDPDKANHNKPVLAANDGASGVGILMEIARQIGQSKPEIGVDIVFFDAEDYGAPHDFKGDTEDSWCLGTQYWASNPHVPGYRAEYGILLDMVGAPNATFYKEQFSMYYANSIVDKVWSRAESLGFGQYFINQQGGAITDDHVYVNKIANIPCIDIIDYNPTNETGFRDYWHTIYDTMENIDKNTLQAVGITLLHVIYNEE